MRDSQRSKVYGAEGIVHGYGGSERLETIPEIEAWLTKLSQYRWYQRRWPSHAKWTRERGWDISDGRGTRIARGGGRHLNLPKWARTKATIVHELAHCLSGSYPPHGWHFCHTQRILVRFIFGKEAERALVKSYRGAGVRYKKPRKRLLTAEQRAAMKERMARVRAARDAARPQ